MVTMREELRQLWLNTSQSREQLAADLQAWCRRAEKAASPLQQFSMRLRAARGVWLLLKRSGPAGSGAGTGKKSPASRGFFHGASLNYFSLVSLYSTCLRALGSNFMIAIFSGMVFLFLLVV